MKHHIENHTQTTARGMANVFGWGPVDPLGVITGAPQTKAREVVHIPSDASNEYKPVERVDKSAMYVTLAVLGLLAIIVVIAAARHWVAGGVVPPKKKEM